MILEEPVPPVERGELVVRFLTHRSQIRADGTVKQSAFIPPSKTLRLSVARRRQTTCDEVWQIAREVVELRGPEHTLCGLGEI